MLPVQEVFSLHLPTPGTGNPDKPGNLRRDFRSDFEMALDMINNVQYVEALKILERLLKEDPDNYNLNFLVGYCYVQNNQKIKARPFLEKAILSAIPDYSDNNYKERNAPVYAYYYLGQSLHWIGKLEEAESHYSKFRAFLVTKNGKLINQKNFEILKEVDAKLAQIVIGKKLMETPLEARFIQIPFLNSPNYSASGVQLSAQNHLLFFNRQKMTNGFPSKSDIFQVKRTNLVWGKVEAAPGTINSPYNDIFSCLSNDSKFFLFASDRKGGYNIYYALQEGNKWTEPYDNLSINTGYNETFASISKDGTSMYFVSDRPGGFGGKDIYRIIKRSDGSWSDPENLGFTINSALNEDSPWLSDDGKTLYFASESHNTMGGYDIFKSEFKNQMWQEPVNLGYPVNSPADELYFKPEEKSNLAFFTSNRGSEGERMEVFCVKYKDENAYRQDVFNSDALPSDSTEAELQTPGTPVKSDSIRPVVLPDKEKIQENQVQKTEETKPKPDIEPIQIQKPAINADSLAKVREKRSSDSLAAIRLKRAQDLQRKLNEERLAEQQKRKADSLTKINQLKEKMAFEAMVIEKKKNDSIRESRKSDSLLKVVKERVEQQKRDSLQQQNQVSDKTEKPDKIVTIEPDPVRLKEIQQQKADSLARAEEQIRKENELQLKEKQEKEAIERQKRIIYAIEQAKKDSLARVSYASQTHKAGSTTRQIENYLITGAIAACTTPSPERAGKFTVQVGAGKMKVNYFKKLEDKRVCFGPDGLARFIVGTYESQAEAEKVAAELRRSGFSDAWAPEIDTRRCPCDDNDMVSDILGSNAGEGPIKYTVQLGAGKMKINYFRNVGQVRLCNGDDGILRFIFGEFSTLEEAEKVKAKLVEIGYKDAWIPEIDENRCHKVILQ